MEQIGSMANVVVREGDGFYVTKLIVLDVVDGAIHVYGDRPAVEYNAYCHAHDLHVSISDEAATAIMSSLDFCTHCQQGHAPIAQRLDPLTRILQAQLALHNKAAQALFGANMRQSDDGKFYLEVRA